MSIDQKELKIRLKAKRNRGLVGALLAIEFILSVVLCVSLAAQIVWPDISGAAAGQIGAPLQLNYEGYLTDSANNPLGGNSGVEYCFHFSVWNAIVGGNQLWPTGTPAVTTATATNGVFNAVVGQANTFASTTFDFSTTSTAYLDVAVNTTTGPTCTGAGSYQELTPRQQILSSGYALTSSNVTSQALTTVEAPTGSTTVQVGMGGTGSNAPVYFSLDNKNTAAPDKDYVGDSCSVNGLVWYDSATSHILVCLGGFVQAMDNNGATTTIAAIVTPGNGVTASSGSIYFANSNGISFGINGQTITASDLGNVTLSYYEPFPLIAATTTLAQGNASLYVEPITLNRAVSMSYVRFPVSMSLIGSSFATQTSANYSSSSSQMNSLTVMLYQTSNNGTVFTSYASTSATWEWLMSATGNSNSHTVTYNLTYPAFGGGAAQSTSMTASSATTAISEVPTNTSLFTGERFLDIPFSTSISAGNYWFGVQRVTAGAAAGFGISSMALSATALALGVLPPGSTSNSTYAQLKFGFGSVAGNSTTQLSSYNLAAVSYITSNPQLYFQFIRSS